MQTYIPLCRQLLWRQSFAAQSGWTRKLLEFLIDHDQTAIFSWVRQLFSVENLTEWTIFRLSSIKTEIELFSPNEYAPSCRSEFSQTCITSRAKRPGSIVDHQNHPWPWAIISQYDQFLNGGRNFFWGCEYCSNRLTSYKGQKSDRM